MSNSAQSQRNPWLGLSALVLPSFLASIDVSIILLALPSIAEALNADATQQLWIIDIYGFLLSGFMVTMGTLGDRIGRRRVLMAGAALFGAASVLAAFSGSAGMLIAARALLGIGGATIMPSSMALISNLFPGEHERGVAFSIWMASFMGGMAGGPVIGGILLENFHWGALFLINVPVMVAFLALAPRLLTEYRNADSAPLDLPSVALSLATILPTTYGLKELAKGHVNVASLLVIPLGFVMGAWFVRRQTKLSNPLLDLRLFKNARFRAVVLATTAIASTGITMLATTKTLQLGMHLPPLRAALYMLPGVLASIAGMLLTPHLAKRINAQVLILSAIAVAYCGVILLGSAHHVTDLPRLVLGYMLFQIGCAPLVSLGNVLIMGSVPLEKVGAASAISGTSSEFGFAFGFATLGTLASATAQSIRGAGSEAALTTEVQVVAMGVVVMLLFAAWMARRAFAPTAPVPIVPLTTD